MIERIYKYHLIESLKPGRAWILYGPRRAGKTFLFKHLLSDYQGKILEATGEDLIIRNALESESVEHIKSFFSAYDLIFIDEAQKINNVGLGLKMLVDNCPEIKVIATGSSSFELANQVGEPLTGRKFTSVLYPVSLLELHSQKGNAYIYQKLNQFLIFGMYPEVLEEKSEKGKVRLLNELRDSYLYKDILELENIKNPRKLGQLLTLLAFQVGKEVSLSELGNNLDMNKITVERYLDLLEKTFVVKRVQGFSRNLRKEITKSHRYYFLDNGILNAVINNYNDISLRNDTGLLWENFVFIERIKKNHYLENWAQPYFWRTYDQQEIDLIEETGGKLNAYEFKWKPKKSRAPIAWAKNYPEAGYDTITQENFINFCT
ncbi:MAG: ATP-binding protein [Planctomycetota bacterium]|jgi:predicted AAA+ superfamily ATPase